MPEVSIDGATYAEADTYFEPSRGLVDGKGNLLIPADKFKKSLNLGGVAISY